MNDLIGRHAQALVAETLADTRVVLVNGARQAGKSTLTRLATAGRPGTAVRLLDDPATLLAASARTRYDSANPTAPPGP